MAQPPSSGEKPQWTETIVTIVASTIVFAFSQSRCQLRYVSSILFLSFASESKINSISSLQTPLSVPKPSTSSLFQVGHMNSPQLPVTPPFSTSFVGTGQAGEVNVASFGESAAFWQGRTYQLLRDDEKPSMCISDPAGTRGCFKCMIHLVVFVVNVCVY